MYEIGSTIIENYNTYPKSNWFIDILKYGLPPFVTLLIGMATIYIGFSTLKRTMLDNLDSKSGWRKTLFEISGKDKITLEDVFKLRACLRFDKKENATNIFDKKTNEMIDFCNDMKVKYDNKYSCESEILFYSDREKVRIYSRYLLANHWEILQLSKREYKKYEKESSYVKQVKPSKKWYQKEKELEERTDQLINDLTP
ncbi:hypothetical protein [Staphylococcus equorum]|uniref:hypothetical protein n=1 Tax=Staphylococcus equorum TaxID=246432 RepID=UPI0025564B62|nr:hypothetical protein [Staphylococcus equorum]MDK9857672.1 hypothetical protein [Staphylococcus equorum]MDK9874732.1 hypothetical protein [Staphylococcus equorum]